ncbi:acetyl-CoA synthetase-like protein [Meira miltonrushii]|uniref:Acetyl-CoA synthetase-like protein n=1 Tax=Meira miltonrushii TaxID=1280837 RepID=A0A316V8F4_9BASI|nr:acetyl-CoA synthetase-like protein [Meira miltonrushii]PWN31755.1 acetyl-CoA synthetase-like protein [Meira miltonrushii]
MIFKSPHPTLDLPQGEEAVLPRFLLDPAQTSDRSTQPILYPPPSSGKAFTSRPNAKALSLKNMCELAYGIANGLINGKLDQGNQPFEKGDVIAIYSPNQHDYVPIVLAIQMAGGIPALCNPSYKPNELAHQLRMTRARAIFTTADAGLQKPQDKKQPKATTLETPFTRAQEAARLAFEEKGDADTGGFDKLDGEPAVLVFEDDDKKGIRNVLLGTQTKISEEDRKKVSERATALKSTDAAVYCFSSGTSGLPKAVVLTHGNLVSNTIQATFLLYDRMNKAVENGARFSKDGTDGWYDKAQAKGAGKEYRPEKKVQASPAKEGEASKKTSKKGINKLISQFKKGFGAVVEVEKNGTPKASESSASSPSSSPEEKPAPQYLGETGFARIESRPKGEQEFHIDVLPQFHCYGLLVNLVAIHTLTPRIILPRFHLETYLSSIQEHGITFGFVVPPILLALAQHPLVDKYDVSTLWRVASGAASLPDEITNAVGARLGIVCTDGYGMTEMSPIVGMQTVSDVKIAPNTVGVLAPNTEAMVLDHEGKQLGHNEPGELLLRGPQMMHGYLRNEEANEKAFFTDENGQKWLRTGDVVKIDESGYIKITDRLKDVIKSKGFQVSPAELEGILFKDERVKDAAIIGSIDPHDGNELPWAFIVPSQTLPEDEKAKDEIATSILKRVNEQVAGYKKIAGITWLDALPKSDAGKVLKKNLASQK